MPNGKSASSKQAEARTARTALAILPLPCLDGDTADFASAPHGHRCVTCAGVYECKGAEDTGLCMPVCQPCYWIELGSQIVIYREMVAELERKRNEVESRLGSEVCRNAAARRSSTKNDASLLVAFGNLISLQPAPDCAPLSTELQGGVSHE